MSANNNFEQIFIKKFQSRYLGIMAWSEFEDFWAHLTKHSNNWFYYDTEQTPPDSSVENMANELEKIYQIIKDLHQERYCGLVFVDDLIQPSFIKIFHPNNLGKSCGSSEFPALPRWVFSKIRPIDIVKKFGEPEKKSGFLNNLFS